MDLEVEYIQREQKIIALQGTPGTNAEHTCVEVIGAAASRDIYFAVRLWTQTRTPLRDN